MTEYINTRLPIPEAALLASLGGIAQDLQGVVTYCKYLQEHDIFESTDLVAWEGLSSAAVVRYARCFASGVRDSLPNNLFEAAPVAIQEAHEYFMALRNKHVAHSVNDFEENEVVAMVGSHFTSSGEIEHVHPNHGRILGLAFEEPQQLIALSEWVLSQVDALIAEAAVRLLPVVRALPIERVRSFGVAALGGGASRESVAVRRRRP